MKLLQSETLTLDKIVGGGQALGTLKDGPKAFVWGGLPGEQVTIRVTKKKSHLVEGVVTEVLSTSKERIEPLDPTNYLSTSPWQIMTFKAEQHYKAALIEEAFELHDIVLPGNIEVYTDNVTAHYRNKVEFSWYSTAIEDDESHKKSKPILPKKRVADEDSEDEETKETFEEWSPNLNANPDYPETLDLAFFHRGSKGKVIVEDCSLLPAPMMALARAIRDLLREKGVTARQLKTLLIRSDQKGNCVWQLYLKGKISNVISGEEAATLPAQGGELIFSDPRSPASRITKRLAKFGDVTLRDTILNTPFNYAAESFFQVNVPVYEQALKDMQPWVMASGRWKVEGGPSSIANSQMPNANVVDLYSGVGTIGLTIGGDNATLVEINEYAVGEMKRNIEELGSNATAVLAPSEKALDYVTAGSTIIVDPPRVGLHHELVEHLLLAAPARIVYLSCNPVTQARDVALLAQKYGIRHHIGYNFFPRTPHIEHLVVLDLKA
ncbi:MAG: RsmD family RNA methyltransferase [Candidatus Saccharimonas sp.]